MRVLPTPGAFLDYLRISARGCGLFSFRLNWHHTHAKNMLQLTKPSDPLLALLPDSTGNPDQPYRSQTSQFLGGYNIEFSCAAESDPQKPQRRHLYEKEDHLRRQLQRFVMPSPFRCCTISQVLPLFDVFLQTGIGAVLSSRNYFPRRKAIGHQTYLGGTPPEEERSHSIFVGVGGDPPFRQVLRRS